MNSGVRQAALGLSCWLLVGIGFGQGPSSSYTVCAQGCPYRSIQAAINAAAEGATVVIGPGLYKENLEIHKNLRMVGAGQSQVMLQPNDTRKAAISVSSVAPLQFYLQEVTLGDPSGPIPTLSSPTPGTGLDIIGPIQTTIRHATFAGLVIGIYIDQGDKFLAPQVVLEEVNLARNGVGLLYQQSQSLLVIRSIIEENLLGLSGGSSILLYNSVVRKNQLAGLVLNMLSAPGPRSLGQINNNEFLQNGIGIYLETGILLPLAEASWIEINQNHINQNLQYAIVVRDPSCPSVSGQSPSSQAVHSGQINFFGSQNEIQNNGKGNLCPSDYRLPPGFVKP